MSKLCLPNPIYLHLHTWGTLVKTHRICNWGNSFKAAFRIHLDRDCLPFEQSVNIVQLILEEYFSCQGFRGLEVNMLISLGLTFQINMVRHQNINNLKCM